MSEFKSSCPSGSSAPPWQWLVVGIGAGVGICLLALVISRQGSRDGDEPRPTPPSAETAKAIAAEPNPAPPSSEKTPADPPAATPSTSPSAVPPAATSNSTAQSTPPASQLDATSVAPSVTPPAAFAPADNAKATPAAAATANAPSLEYALKPDQSYNYNLSLKCEIIGKMVDLTGWIAYRVAPDVLPKPFIQPKPGMGQSEKLRLFFSGFRQINSRDKPKDAEPVVATEHGKPTNFDGTLVINRFGELLSTRIRSDENFPFFLGSLPSYIFDPLSAKNENAWQVERQFVISETEVEFSPQWSLSPSMYSRPMMPRPPSQYRGRTPSYSLPSGKTTTTTTNHPAVEKVRYEIVARTADTVEIHKHVEIKTLESEGSPRYFLLEGKGKTLFDLKLGAPRHGEFRATVTHDEDNLSIRVPLEVAYDYDRRETVAQSPRDSTKSVAPPAKPNTETKEPAKPREISIPTHTTPVPKSPRHSKPAAKNDVPDPPAEREYRRFGDLGWGVESLAFSPDGRFLATGKQDQTLILFDVEKSQRVAVLEKLDDLGSVTCLAFSLDGRKLLCGGRTGLIIVWNVAADGSLSEDKHFAGHSNDVRTISLSPVDKRVFSGGGEKKLRCWNLETGREHFLIDGFHGGVKASCILPDGKKGLASDGDTLMLIDLEQGKAVQTYKLGPRMSQAAAISRDGSKIAVGEHHGVRVWEVDPAKELPKLEDEEIQWSAAFSPDGKYLFSGGRGKANQWDLASQRKVKEYSISDNLYVKPIACSADGRYLAAIPSAAGQEILVFRIPEDTAGKTETPAGNK